MNKLTKLALSIVFITMISAAGFTFTVQEGQGAVISRFGRIASVHTTAGLHLRLPWPIDTIITYDTRYQYLNSGYIETLTNDMINIILQTYIIWDITDLPRFHTSVGNYQTATSHLNDLVSNTKNGVLGNYTLASLISTDIQNIQTQHISNQIETIVAEAAYRNFGIGIQRVNIKRVALPNANIQSIFEQMRADRQRYVSQYLAYGERDAAIIISEAQAMAAEILAQGMLQASEIDAQTQSQVAALYAQAYNRSPELFEFLTSLIALENSVNPDTTIIMRSSDSPLGIITSSQDGSQ